MNMSKKFHQWANLALLLSLTLAACGSAPPQSWPGLAATTDTAYVTNTTHLYAVNTADGLKRWQFPKDNDSGIGPFFADPLLVGDKIIITSFNKSAYALNASTGDQVWVFSESKDRLIAPAAVAGGIILIASADSTLYAVDLNSGNRKWTFTAKSGLWAAPLVTDEMIFVPSMDHRLYAVNPSSGAEIWSVELNGALAGTPALTDGVLYIGSLNDTLYALNPQNGRELWSLKTSGWVWGSPLVDGDSLYFGDLQGIVYSVDAKTGAVNWQVQPWQSQSLNDPRASAIRSTPVLIGDKLIVPSEQGIVYALNTKNDGAVLWQKSLDDKNADRLFTNAVVVGNTVLIAPLLAENAIYALNASDGSIQWFFKPQ